MRCEGIILSVLIVSNTHEIKQVIALGVTLKNPANSIHYLGLGYIYAMKSWVEENYPELAVKFICDCAANAALAHQAMTMGFKYVLFTGSDISCYKLQDVAKILEVELLAALP
jgi:hypothetical protein